MNKQYYFLIPFILFLTCVNFLLFYYIIGPSVLIYFGILLFIILVIFCVYYYYYQRKVKPYPKLIIKQEGSLEQESLIHNLQSKAFRTIEKTNFIFHKKILIIELIIIVILFLNLILRVWQKE